MTRWFLCAGVLTILMSGAGLAMAHEYWLDPVGTQWQAGNLLQADIRNGQDLVGTPYPFDPYGLTRAGLISEHSRLPLNGKLGDYPAIQIPLDDAGLNLLLLETTQRELKYQYYSDFETFLDYHGLADIKQRHQDLGLPTQNIIEHYYRYSKALLMVDAADTSSSMKAAAGTKPERDMQESTDAALQPQKQRFELVALENPFDADSLQLQLLFEGKPTAQRQVELFHRNGLASAVRSTAVSDENGLVTFDITSAGDYLVNSVLALEPGMEPAQWITLWASLFFQQTER